MPNTWNYNGDVNIEYGGLFWREDGGSDYVLAVRLTPCSDAGGPDNLFHIESGSVYMPEDEASRRSALSTCGYDVEGDTIKDCSGRSFSVGSEHGRFLLVDSWVAYHGICREEETVIRIGPEEDKTPNGWNPSPDIVLRRNANLRRYVENNFLD